MNTLIIAGMRERLIRYLPAFLLLILILPRMIRLLSPYVWVESEAYLNCAFLVSRGFKPYVDFALCHPPGAEALLATLFFLFGASIRTAEIFSQILVFFSSILIFAIGRRISGKAVGVIAAVLYSFSYVIFRYHVFEREIFIGVLVLAAAWFVLDLVESKELDRKQLFISLLLTLAFTVKLTVVAHTFGLLVYLALSGYGMRKTFSLLCWIILLSGFVFLGFYLLYGKEFIINVFLFQFLVHASAALAPRLRLFKEILDINLSLALSGLLLIILQKDWRRWILPFSELFFTFLFIVLLNATFWPHNGIELLPWLSLLGGYFIAKVITAIGERNLSRPVIISTLVCVVLIIFVFPVKIADWGFGYEKRSEIAKISKFIKQHTKEADEVFVPSIIAFEANRKEIIPFQEIAGTMIDLQMQVESNGWVETLFHSNIDQKNFGGNVEYSKRFWLPTVFEALKEKRVAAVMNAPMRVIAPLANVTVKDTFLQSQGYVAVFRSGPAIVWLPRSQF